MPYAPAAEGPILADGPHPASASIQIRSALKSRLLSEKIISATSTARHVDTNVGKGTLVAEIVQPTSPPRFPPLSNLTKIMGCDVLRDGHIVQDEPLWVRDGKFVDPMEVFYSERRAPDVVIDLSRIEDGKIKRMLIVPGFIDLQINGSFGVDFSDPDVTEEDIRTVACRLLRYGVTAFCPTLVSSEASVYRRVLPLMIPRRGSIECGAEVLGAHVEGPFISPERVGAHERSTLRTCANGFRDIAACYGLDATSTDPIQCLRLITVAPEVEGVMNVIPELVRRGVTVSIGHTSASIKVAEEAVQCGARMVTHLFNAMAPFHHRDPGPVGLVGSAPDLIDVGRPSYGIIVDGVHAHPSSVRIAYYSHPEGCVLVTDAISAAQTSGGGSTPSASRAPSPLKNPPVTSMAGGSRKLFWLGSKRVIRRSAGEVVLESSGSLAGSTASMPQCIRNMINFTDCTLARAIDAATIAPARLLGIEGRKGRIAPGCDADLVVLDVRDKGRDFEIASVFVAGQRLIV